MKLSIYFLLLVVSIMTSTSLHATMDSSMKVQLEKQFPRVGVATMVFKDGKILLGQRKGAHGVGEWACPGGHLEFGETVEECARRELAEETGLEIVSFKLGPWTENLLENGKKHYITLFVFVTEFTGEVQLLEPDKCQGWDWFSLDELPSPIFLTIKSVVQKLKTEGLKE